MLRTIGVVAARGRPPDPRLCVPDDVRDRTRLSRAVVPHPAGTLRFELAQRTDRPPGGVLLHVHGGGWVLGSAAEFPAFRRVLADRTGLIVASVDYPLAPEHPFPAGLDVVQRALGHLATALPPGCPLFVGGDSAGGNLATVAVRRWVAGGGRRPDGQLLVYPLTDHRLDRASHLQHGRSGGALPLEDLAWFREQYLSLPELADQPDVSPLRSGELALLPPTVLVLAERDPVRDEGLDYAAALRRAGVSVETHVLTDEEHGFLTQVGVRTAADDAIKRLARFVAAVGTSPQAFDLVDRVVVPSPPQEEPA